MNDKLTVPETARFCKRHYLTVLRAIKAGKLKATRYGHQFLVTPEDIAEYIANRRPAGFQRKRKPAIMNTCVGGVPRFDLSVVLAKTEPLQVQLNP